MDISSKDFVIYAIDDRKKVKLKDSIAPSRKGLKDLIEKLGKEKKLFVFEAGNQMKWIADFLKKNKQDIHVVHPNEVKWIITSNGKTDKVDAKKLADLARADMLPRRVHVAEGKVRDLRELINARTTIQSKRISIFNTIRGYLKQEGVKLPMKFFGSKEWSEKLASMRLHSTNHIIVAQLMKAADGLKDCELEITKEISEIEDKKIELIETVPAIGKLTARILFSALATADRFDNSKCVANYGALAPTIYQSGDTKHMGPINRDGRKEVRKALLQCAHTIARMKSPGVKPLKEFFTRIEKRRGKKRAVVALARKLLTTVYGVLKSGEVYDPAKLQAA